MITSSGNKPGVPGVDEKAVIAWANNEPHAPSEKDKTMPSGGKQG
ncbi:MAG: hypothetical protein ABSF99_03500 [Anaerolineales bacterium]